MLERLIVAIFFVGSNLVRGIAPAPLVAALNSGVDIGLSHWAYTEVARTIISDGPNDKAPSVSETIVRFDPSKPYPEQYTPLKIEDKAPTKKQLQEYRRKGEKRAEELEREANEAKNAKPEDAMKMEIYFGDKRAVADFASATLASQSDSVLTYRVPLRSEGLRGLPVDKTMLTLDVDKERHVLTHASIQILAPFRVALVEKVRQCEMSFDWKTIDPKYPPVAAAKRLAAATSKLFLKANLDERTERTDFKRVTPSDDRFGVKIGPLRTLAF